MNDYSEILTFQLMSTKTQYQQNKCFNNKYKNSYKNMFFHEIFVNDCT